MDSGFAYTVTSGKDFDTTVKDIMEKVEEKGFRVQHVHDVQATLAQKGFQSGPLKIIEICNAKYAHQVLQRDVQISLMMPCKINVYVQAGRTTISALRPVMLAQFFPQADLGDVAAEVDGIIRGIVDEAR